jgi:hypothetical protein
MKTTLRQLLVFLTFFLTARVLVHAQNPTSSGRTALLKPSATGTADIAGRYGDITQKIIEAALRDSGSLARLQYLCDRIGTRLSGSAGLERAIEWSAAEMTKAGLENVRKSPVMIPHWVRGAESAAMLAPVQKPLTMVGFGGSVGTPAAGITAEAVTVRSLDQLNKLGREKVAGKIVVFVPTPEGSKRVNDEGPARAAELGAVALLIRNGFSMQGPHTGALKYPDGAVKIPAAAILDEDGELMVRLAASAVPVRLQLKMEAHREPEVQSFNVIGDLRGSEKPEEIVLLGGHIDSWDVGQGAHDNGTGMMASLEAVLLIKKLGLQPRRTMRVVFWTNEENGHSGSSAYGVMVGDAVKDHVAAIEDDHGAEKPVGFGFGTAQQKALFPAAFQRALEIGGLLKSIDGGRMLVGGAGGDIRPLCDNGVPGFKIRTVESRYDEYHHTNADTFDKVVPQDFRLHVASLAVLGYVLADMPEHLSEMK